MCDVEYGYSRYFVSATGGGDTLESAVQKMDAGYMMASHGHYRESPMGIGDQPSSDDMVLTSRVCNC